MDDTTEIEKQIKDITLAIEKEPNNAQLYFDRGNKYVQINFFDKAILDFNKVINLDNKDKDAYNNRGVSFLKGRIR